MARILLADENTLVLDLMQIFLSEDGHELCSAKDRDTLMRLARESDGVFTMLVVSADMEPGYLTGLINEVRQLSNVARVPVLVTVPPGATGISEELAGLQGVETLQKPFDRGSFLASIRSILLLDGGDQQQQSSVPAPAGSPVLLAIADNDNRPVEDHVDVQAVLTPKTEELVSKWLEEHGAEVVARETRAYLEKTAPTVLAEVAWKVVPELAEDIIRAEIARLGQENEELESTTRSKKKS
ncbi:MAG: hypothetical protein CMH54_12805 [Myxococcales bacterium]|nr:hypothetical protein [Myxococcales bacterium]|tara:strand:- start:396 stop:1118 length:723 start_codon:yes stop_codon:yes gene_type:complete